ncbi:hypothetical protein HZS55_22070 [Halosimplex rubrum]|uniref:Uncharacterized protein n=1 Tax=Halosimplex rubrum TaxID=869889 RepID=A0A7D5T9M3_9EURY|nr:hypothetical protein [Halosimplex rubrum]QLH79815.1 hypothetical protein HZS55_22070 [Halosimplex rubrum]
MQRPRETLRRFADPVKSIGDSLRFQGVEYWFLLLALVSLILISLVNYEYNLDIYQNLMAGIGLAQALITGYLSYKIFKISRRDSVLPNLDVSLSDATFDEVPITERTDCECDVIVKNESYGSAKIRDIGLVLEYDLEVVNFNKEPRGDGGIVYKNSSGPPLVLDRGEELTLNIYIPSYPELDQLVLQIDESDLGDQRYQISKFNIRTAALAKQTDLFERVLEQQSIERT